MNTKSISAIHLSTWRSREAKEALMYWVKQQPIKAFSVYDALSIAGGNGGHHGYFTWRKRFRAWVKRGEIYRTPKRLYVQKGKNSAYLFSFEEDPDLREQAYQDYIKKHVPGDETGLTAADFKSVSDMVSQGYYLTHFGKVRKIPRYVRIGLPEDDLILSTREINRLIAAIDEGNRRDRLLFGLLFRTGGRISQNLRVKLCDVDLEKRRVFIQRAKEGLSFYRELDDGFLQELIDYAEHYELTPEDSLFSVIYPLNPFSKQWFYDRWAKQDEPISRRVAWQSMMKAAKKAGLQYAYIDDKGYKRWRIHPHASKRTVASELQEISKDSLTAALTIGNRSTACLEKHYVKVRPERRHEVARAWIEKLSGAPKVQVKEIKEAKR